MPPIPNEAKRTISETLRKQHRLEDTKWYSTISYQKPKGPSFVIYQVVYNVSLHQSIFMCIMKPMRFLRIRLNKWLTKATVADDVHDAFCKCKFLRIRVSRKLFHATDLLQELKLLCIHSLSSKSIQSAEASDSNRLTWRNAKMLLE